MRWHLCEASSGHDARQIGFLLVSGNGREIGRLWHLEVEVNLAGRTSIQIGVTALSQKCSC